jgi:hypothetical protein
MGLNPNTRSNPFSAQWETLMVSRNPSGWAYSTSSTGLSRPEGSRESANHGAHGFAAHAVSSAVGAVTQRPGSVASIRAAESASVRR